MKKRAVFLLCSILFAALTVALGSERLFASPLPSQQNQGSEIQTGVFYLVQGLSYSTPTQHGITNENGEFRYRPGEVVTFAVGSYVLGSAPGAKQLTSANLDMSVSGDINKLAYAKCTNMARLLLSLDEDNNLENGITITPQTAEIVGKYAEKLKPFESEAAFTGDPNVVALFSELHKELRSGPEARNYLHWAILGVQIHYNVKIPTRDGAYVTGYVYRPIAPGKYPIILAEGEYGMAIFRGCICNRAGELQHAATLDSFFQGNPNNMVSENFELADASYWVPKGFAVVKVDNRGVCTTPGVLNQYGVQQARDEYDAVEWLAKQPWSNGNVGTYGASLYGIDQFAVASLQPPHLKAMVDVVGDESHYREIVYAGGILNTAQYRGSLAEHNGVSGNGWYFDSVKVDRCQDQKTFENAYEDKEQYWLEHPFNDPPWYGTDAQSTTVEKNGEKTLLPLEVDADMSKVKIPFLASDSFEHANHQHIKGEIDAYLDAATPAKDKMLYVVTGDDINGWLATNLWLPTAVDFMNHWLKGTQNGIMDGPLVRMMMRTGNGAYYWDYEKAYPVPSTKYTKYYLDAHPSNWTGDGKRSDFLKVTTTPPAEKASTTYSADVKYGKENGYQCDKPGMSFVTEPLSEDLAMAGFGKVHLWVSSTSSDMDVFASVRVMGPDNQEVPYAMIDNPKYYPLAEGWEKVSHRALDPKKSTDWLPITLDTKASYAPLKSPDEVVPVDVELEPFTGVIHKGERIRVDIQPVEGCDFGAPAAFPYAFTGGTDKLQDVESYQDGAHNTIYTGGDHSSYLQLPLIPAKESGAENAAMANK